MSEQTFDQMYTEDHGAESAADTPETAPASAPSESAPAAEPETAPEGQPSADTATATGDEEWRFNSQEWDTLHPELATYRKQLQASFTKAQQKLAEDRKPLEGVDQQSVEWVRRFNEAVALGQTQVAQTMLQEVQQQLQGAPAPQAGPYAAAPDGEPIPPDQDSEWEYMTDTEKRLAVRGYQAEMRAYRAEQRVSHHDLAGVRNEVERQFGSIAQQAGVEIPFEQRQAVLQKMGSLKAPPSEIATYWWGMFGRDVARRQGVAEGERLTLQKAQAGPRPSAHVPAANGDDGIESAPDFRTALTRAHGNV